MRREHIIYILLFGVSYAGFLSYFYRNGERSADARQQTLGMSSESRKQAIEPTEMTHSRISQPSTTVSSASAKSVPKLQRTAQVMKNSQQDQIQEPTPLVIDYTSPQATFRTLESAALSDEYAQNRALAVASLRQLAASGDANGQIREALRIAATDADPAVADSARAAYDEVSEWATMRK